MRLIVALALTVSSTWVCYGTVMYWAKVFTGSVEHKALRPFRWVFAELRPFYLAAVLIIIARDVVTGSLWGDGWRIFSDAMALVTWWLYKDIDDDDDRWKRRRTKVLGRVKALASGRLVVAPVGAQ